MSFDEYNRIRTTDMRLLRRMVRDSQFRSHDAETTLRTWSDVREGEEKYIFPYQSSADIIFNTTLIYEFAVLKKYAEPLLRAVPQSAGMAYTTARRLLNILSYVKPLEDEVIPNNSILREFIGGSVFKDALWLKECIKYNLCYTQFDKKSAWIEKIILKLLLILSFQGVLQLAEKARYFKETEKGLTNMGDVFEKFAAKRAKEAAEATTNENKIEFAKGLLADGMSIEFTVRHSKLSEAEVRELASKLSA